MKTPSPRTSGSYSVDRGVDPRAMNTGLPSRGGLVLIFDGMLDHEAFRVQMRRDRLGHRLGRYFGGDDELLHYEGRTCALTKTWGSSTRDAIDRFLSEFPDHPIRVTESGRASR